MQQCRFPEGAGTLAGLTTRDVPSWRKQCQAVPVDPLAEES